MTKYVALVHKDPTSDFGVSFPDFPGCVSAGETYELALHSAVEALAFHVDMIRKDGEPIPAPRDVATIRAEEDWIDWDDAIVTMVPLIPADGAAVRLNISLDSGLLDEIDRTAKALGMTRSAYLARAARIALSSAA